MSNLFPDLPIFRISSEAHGKNTKVIRLPIDRETGEPIEEQAMEVKGLTGVDVRFAVHDAVRLTFNGLANFTEIETQGIVTHRVNAMRQGSGGWLIGEGSTQLEALKDLVEQLEMEPEDEDMARLEEEPDKAGEDPVDSSLGDR